VRVFKCGPDFLDPYWHQLASGAPVHNLDGWMVGMDEVRARLHAAAGEADVILIEGVMGLFDGSPSAADLAQRWACRCWRWWMRARWPARLAPWCCAVPAGLPWAGVLANRVATGMHAQMLQTSLREPDLAGRAGAHRPGQGCTAAAGAPPGPGGRARAARCLARLNAAADQLADTPLGQMDWAAWQRWSVEFLPPPRPAAAGQQALQPWLQGRTVAMARDAAFSFIYPANLDCCRPWGPIWLFSPLAGEACRPAMPCGCPAAIRNCMPASWPPTPGCRPICAPTWPQASPCGPNAAACWPWAGR
jgi:cobyrinic acid a,c-diamide synthase